MRRLVLITFAVLFAWSCSTTTDSKSRLTTNTEVEETDTITGDTVVTRKSITEVDRSESHTEHENHDDRGILSVTVGFIGDVIAFPFRLVGSLVNALF